MVRTTMPTGESATDMTAAEGIARFEKHYPPTGVHAVRRRKTSIAGPTKTSKTRSTARRSPYSTTRCERARAPSPPDVPDWPTDFCLFMDCDISMPHFHTKKEIRERVGYSTFMETLFGPEWSTADDSEVYDGLFRGRPPYTDTRVAGAETSPPDAMLGEVSSILDPYGDGLYDLLKALPDTGDVAERLAGDQNLSGSQVLEITAGIENLTIPRSDQSKTRSGNLQ